MIKAEKNYWLNLEPYVYVSFSDNKLLLYNTQTGYYVETTHKRNIDLIKSLHEKKNLGVALLKKEDLEDTLCYSFIDNLCENKIGIINDVSLYIKKPISLIPILNLQRDVEKLKNENERFLGEDVMRYLTNISIYVNNACEQNCQNCSSYYKQVSCCTKDSIERELPIEVIRQLMDQLQHAPISAIQILGGNCLSYSNLEELLKIIPKSIKTHYWIHYKNLIRDNSLNLLSSLPYKDIIIDFPFDTESFDQVLTKVDTNTTLHFIVENNSQLEDVERITDKAKGINFKIVPFYNGNNTNFFKEAIFLSKEDIFSEPIEQRKIFCNQALNSNYFGTLYVFPNGDVKASCNSETLGSINNNKILDVISVEMDKNTAWRKIRKNEPCNNCLYQYLCPPPSNYEYTIGVSNLCHILNE